jgi:hypothetical protein
VRETSSTLQGGRYKVGLFRDRLTVLAQAWIARGSSRLPTAFFSSTGGVESKGDAKTIATPLSP